MKNCTKCKTEKLDTEFYSSNRWRCKLCLKAGEAIRRAKDPEYLTKWRKKNPDAARRWYLDNKKHKAAYNAQWYATNKESERVRYVAWARANPGKVNALIAKRSAAKLKATPSWANQKAIEAFYAEAVRLTKATGIRYEVDHIVPLQGKTVRGMHWEGNLQVLPKSQNISKNNRHWPDMPC